MLLPSWCVSRLRSVVGDILFEFPGLRFIGVEERRDDARSEPSLHCGLG